MTERTPEQKPAFAIVVEGGVVQAVVSAQEHLVYRILDFDGQHPSEWNIGNALTDAEGVNIDVFTRDAIASRQDIFRAPAPDAHLESEFEDRVSGFFEE